MNKKESLDGSFPIMLKITHEKLIIQNSHYKFSDIQLLKLTTDDYTNMPSSSYVNNIQYPSKSNGSYNHLWFVNKGKKYKLRFRIDSLQHQKELIALKKRIGID